MTNNLIQVYWVGEEYRDRSTLQRYSWKDRAVVITKRGFLRSSIDLGKLVCVEAFVSGVEYTNAISRKEHCMKQLGSIAMFQDYYLVDANCEGQHALLMNRFSIKPLVLVSKDRTNIISEFDPYTTSGVGAVNRYGDCAFVPPVAGSKREHSGRFMFAVFKNGTWWESSVTSSLPVLSDVAFNRTSSIPALVSQKQE